MSKRVYVGRRDRHGEVQVSFYDDNILAKTALTPERSIKVWNHSPAGFEVGYQGSGPAQLSLALLLEELDDDELASKLHQLFKRDVVAKLDRAGFVLPSGHINEWINRHTLPCPRDGYPRWPAYPVCNRCHGQEIERIDRDMIESTPSACCQAKQQYHKRTGQVTGKYQPVAVCLQCGKEEPW